MYLKKSDLKISQIILLYPLVDCFDFRASLAGRFMCSQNINKYLNTAKGFDRISLEPNVKWVLLCLVHKFSDQSKTEWERLHDHLLQNYNKAIHPVLDHNNSVKLAFGIALIDFNIDEHESTMTSDLWMRYVWNDVHLKWDPKDFSNINLMHIGYIDCYSIYPIS